MHPNQPLTVDLAVAQVTHLENVSYNEQVKVYFEGETPWLGAYGVKVFNSEAKNTEYPMADALEVEDTMMTLLLRPATQGLVANTYYYEISSITDKRVLVKGTLKIIK